MLAKSRIRSVEGRKKFLYSLLNDKYIQDLLMEDKIEDAKEFHNRASREMGEHSK